MYHLTKTKYLLDPELCALNATLEKFADRDPRNTTLIWLAIHTGARASELLNTTPADLDPHEQTIFLRGLKGSDDRDIPLPPWLFALAQAHIPFNISYNRFRQIWYEYRPVKKKLHCLRHTFAINLYRKTKDLRLLQVALGHKSWNNTMIYAQYQFKTSELRRGILG